MPKQEEVFQRICTEYSGFVIIQLVGNLPPPDVETLQEYARRQKLTGLLAVLEKYQLETRRAIHSLSVAQVLELERRAAANRKKKKLRNWNLPSELPLPSLTRFWELDARKQNGKFDELLRDLNKLKGEVDFAYKEQAVSDASEVNPFDEDFFRAQGYLKPAAEGGIDAGFAWEFTKGAGVTFADLERGWYPQHQDLRTITPTYYGGTNWVDGDNHGTSVLGVVGASDNTFGVVGIAPGVSTVKLTSSYQAAGASHSKVANALAAVLPSLIAGDVLLIEVQKSLKPVECELLDFIAIKNATDSDIIVIEVAGNGGFDLDGADGRVVDVMSGGVARIRSLNRGSANFMDSGAIMVGASHAAFLADGRHRRLNPTGSGPESNFGSRIDCYAWGEGIATTSTMSDELGASPDAPTPPDLKSKYTNSFGGTSGAGAIIAGVALLLQSRYQDKNGGARLLNFEPELRDMRTILSTRGTASPDPIGVMPDLKRIFSELGLDIV